MLFNRSKFFVLTSAILLSISSIAVAQSGRVQPTPTPERDDDPVRVLTQEVKVNVIAFDEEGRFVTDVKEADLVITENDILHQASSVRRIPANVLIVMDTGGEMRQIKSLDQTRKVAKGIAAALRPEDSIAVMQYSDKAEIIAEWTDDREQIMAAVGKRSKFGRRSAFTEAINLATDFLSKNTLENKHLVLITDGTDSAQNRTAKADALRSLLSTDINVHVISYTRLESTDITPRTKMISNTPPPKAMPDEVAAQLPNGVRDNATRPKIGPTINLDRTLLRRLKARKADLEASEDALAELAENTNGEIVLADTLDEMVDKTALVAKMIDSSYVLTYTPKVPLGEQGQPNTRNIEVTSKRPNLIVQAKRKLIVDTGNR
ncbi:MAG: VWA domain-containing protein [Saprospiraceae bacterium]|nr:VWA domain-containing protein [Pyrinomonadaceae bacterium]